MTTIKPGSVVVGVDGSAFSDAAVEWAADYAAAHHAPLCVLHGAGDLGGYLLPFRAEARDMARPVAHRIIEAASETAKHRAPELEVDAVTVFEDPRYALLHVEQASMVVVGTRGHGPVAGLLLGSVSQAVAAHATTPVTVVRPAEGRDDDETGKVVVGVILDDSDRDALDMAFEIAAGTSRPVEALHARRTQDIGLEGDGRESVHLGEQKQLGSADAVKAHAEKYPDVKVSTREVDEAPAAALVRASETAAHVVVGSRGDRRVPRYLTSVALAVVERAHCPVTVVRPVSSAHSGGTEGAR